MTPTPPSYFAITASTGLDGVTELTSPWSPSPLVRGQPSSTTTQAVVGNISYAKLGGTGASGSIMVARASAVGVTLSVINDGDVLTSPDTDVSKLVVWTGTDWVDSATWLPA